jgi:hypothetical protein
MVTIEDEAKLRVKFEKFTDDVDQVYEPSRFGSLEDLLDFEKRFRPLSIQVQDHECDRLVQDVKVCASRNFGPDDLRFYDAVVDSVSLFCLLQHVAAFFKRCFEFLAFDFSALLLSMLLFTF